MPARLALVCLCLFGCTKEKPSQARETYDYLVTPAGERFRVIGAGPITRGANTRLGLRISYVSEAREVADLAKHAETLVAVLGPEMQLSGEKTLIVRARLGSVTLELDPGGRRAYDLEYHLEGGKFRRRESVPAPKPPSLRGLHVADDPTFPFKPAKVEEAAAAAMKWIALLDAEDLTATRAEMTNHFRELVSEDSQYHELIERRQQAGLPGTRRELYRQQERSQNAKRHAGDDVMLVFECTPARGPRVIERVVMARYASGWMVSGYAFQPVP